jgi:hypothetical protein
MLPDVSEKLIVSIITVYYKCLVDEYFIKNLLLCRVFLSSFNDAFSFS